MNLYIQVHLTNQICCPYCKLWTESEPPQKKNCRVLLLTAQTEIMMLVRYLLLIPLGSNRGWSFQFQHYFEFSRLYSEMQPTELTVLITHYLGDTTKCITRTVWALFLIQCLFHVFLRDNIVAGPEWRDLVITFLVYIKVHTATRWTIRHGLILLWFTDLMNVTEEVTIHRPNVSTLLSSAFIRGDLNTATRDPFIWSLISGLFFWRGVNRRQGANRHRHDLKERGRSFLVYFEDDCWITGWSNLFFVLFVLNFTWRTLYSPFVSLTREA